MWDQTLIGFNIPTNKSGGGMSHSKRYSSCSKCLESALEMDLNQEGISWEELGNSRPQCSPCLNALRGQFQDEAADYESSEAD